MAICFLSPSIIFAACSLSSPSKSCIRFCREINSEPIIVVSVKFERPAEEYDSILQDAVNWLRYCNAPATDEWGAKRAANGHPEPYNVKYWEIDNEMWEMGIDRYEKCVRDFSTAMRKIDPSIKIIACGGFREDEQFIQRSGRYFDYLSLHHYEQQGGYATGPVRLGQQYDRYAKMIADGPNPNIQLFISEWNLNSIDWRTGLFAGGFLNMCEARDVVAMGMAMSRAGLNFKGFSKSCLYWECKVATSGRRCNLANNTPARHTAKGEWM